MFRVLFLMIALLAGLIAGPYLSGQQGYVRIETANTVYEMSLTTLVILFVVALAVIYTLEWIVTRFFRLSSNTYNWFSRRKRVKAQRQTLEGLMKMNEGDYAKAEKLIGKNAKHSAEPVLNLIKAAEAAQQRGDEFSANRYLIEATELPVQIIYWSKLPVPVFYYNKINYRLRVVPSIAYLKCQIVTKKY